MSVDLPEQLGHFSPAILARAKASGREPKDIAAIRRFYASWRSTKRAVAPGAYWAMGAAYPKELKP